METTLIIILIAICLFLLVVNAGTSCKVKRLEKEKYKLEDNNESLVIENDNLKDLLNIKTN